MVPEIIEQQDREQARQFLQVVTEGWGDLHEPAVIELRCLFPGRTPDVRRFNPTPNGIDALIDHAAAMNAAGLNTYPVINPVRASAPLCRGGRASGADDSDIIGAFWFWADGDDEAAVYAIKNFAGPKWTMAVTTGRVPHPRPHIYWRVEDGPILNLEQWQRIQQGIAAQLSTDKTVVNPSRIMRLPGMVNWPNEKKVSKGRVAELATLRTEYDDDRDPVPFERMRRIFEGAAPAQKAGDGFQIDTGALPTLDRALAAANILAGTDWRENVKKLVASYVARGWTDDEIVTRCLAFTLPGWTDDETRGDVAAFIKWTRRREAENGGKYSESPEKTGGAAAIVPVPDAPPFDSWQEINPLTLPRREFVYGNHYIRRFASVTVAPGGLGKSTLVLAEMLAIATGRPILGITPTKRERVVYYNAEDPTEEIDRRVLAICALHGICQKELVGWFYRSSGRDKDIILAAGENGEIAEPVFEYIEKWALSVNPGVFAFDPLANMTESPETNDVFRRLGKRISRMADTLNCSIEIVHHTRKLNGREAEIEDSRGGGALIGAVRAGRVLNPMTPDEAVRAGLDTHIDHFRIEAAGKNNLSRPAPNAIWFQRIGVDLPNGDQVAAPKLWAWPDAFDGVSADDARRVQVAVAEMEGAPPRESSQAKAWVGHLIGRILGFDTDDKAERERVKQIVKAWVKSGVLLIEEARDSRTGRDVKVVLAGPNNPASNAEGGA